MIDGKGVGIENTDIDINNLSNTFNQNNVY